MPCSSRCCPRYIQTGCVDCTVLEICESMACCFPNPPIHQLEARQDAVQQPLLSEVHLRQLQDEYAKGVHQMMCTHRDARQGACMHCCQSP